MRKPRKHVAKDGTESWKVRYRTAAGTESSETFYEEDDALEFSRLIRAIGVTRALAYIDDREKETGGHGGQALTVDELFEKWIAWKGAVDKTGKVFRVRSKRTIHDYRRMYRTRVKPTFGRTPANLLAAVDVQSWIDQLSEEIEPKTIADYHSLLHGMFLYGLHPNRGLVIQDPCSDTQLPERRKKRPKGLRPEEWLLLHQAATTVDPSAADLLLFMVSTGWRWSECVAAQALSVDHWIDGDGRSHTYVTMGRVLRREGNTFMFVEDAKSEAGERRVRIVGPGEDMVLRRIQGKKPTDLILTTKTGKRWSYSNFYQRTWARPKKGKDTAPRQKRILEEAARLGLERPDLTLHWLRHTHVGMLILAGEPLTAIQRRLGHASIKTTSDTYGRMIEDASESGLDKVAALMGGAPQPRQIR
jgi:integrase